MSSYENGDFGYGPYHMGDFGKARSGIKWMIYSRMINFEKL